MHDLKHADEFRAILKNYQPDISAKQLLAQTELVIMLGISGSGRNTIINHLVELGHYRFIVSDTTRKPKLRDGKMEVDGVNYNFRSEDEVLAALKNGRFLEAELIHNMQVSGINISELEKAIASDLIPINEVDVEGTKNIRAVKPDTKFFFVVPPSYEEWISRLNGREVMDELEFTNRCRTAIEVLKEGLAQPDFRFIVNYSSLHSATEVDRQVKMKVIDQQSHQLGKKVAEAILAELQARF